MTRTAKLIDETRVVELLDCYGADPHRWPEEERASALSLIKHSEPLRRHQQQARLLDEAMRISDIKPMLATRPPGDLLANIVDGLPDQRADNTLEFADHIRKKSPAATTKWWQYSAVAAAAVLVLAVVLITGMPKQDLHTSQPLVAASATRNDLDQWLLEQATGLSDEENQNISQDDDEPEGPTSFMAMVELESATSQN